ncbi:MAG: multifunctional 2',3'-cyclic-nucleotide 2'-phosphodiesterase/5'-nucleotidase/3'-nucleotidase [Hyphomicrobiales bacterium]|nr:5'-nucleotidase C-terminal domain-containing protein [Hyphomicrobiales bacterium]PCH49626.1 MAG: multifunctional 2',3'-cyclic-nucleotide 2'-phosphodiesterase/5'-nucleotidase/3'-nucleotidase [Hyphomicrobiales bacterium]
MNKLFALTSVSLVAFGVSTAQADYSLNILHINDLHSRIEPINKYNATCSQKDKDASKCFGGIARVKTKIDARRSKLEAHGDNVIVLDAGDQFQGSLFYSKYKGSAAVEFLNAIKPDAMAVGNHEFDDGPQKLADFITAAKFPVISGNTKVENTSILKGLINGYVIVEKGGERIGIVSVLATDTGETSSPGEDVSWIDTVEYLNSIVPKLQSYGINKIIAVTHVGLEEDKRIAQNVIGIDVIVGGHSHTLLSNTDKRAADKYPVWKTNPAGQKVPIVQAYAYSKYVGELRVVFDDEGNVKDAYGNPHLLDSSVAPYPPFVRRIADLAVPIEDLKSQVVGSTTGVIDGDRNSCRLKECEMGNLVADAMLDRTKSQGVTITIINGGGLRASIGAGQTTMGDVLTVLPFQNALATFELSGADIIASLESGVSQTAEVKGRFPQVAGLRYAWDESVEAGKGRIKQVQVMYEGDWTDIDESKLYKVVSNDFMRAGGDGYKLFKNNGLNAYDFGPGLEQVVANYIAKNSPYKPYTDGRVLKGAMFAAMMKKPAMKPMMAVDYMIRKGDNLWNIAKDKLGDAQMWKSIKDMNGVKNVRTLKIGDMLKLK